MDNNSMKRIGFTKDELEVIFVSLCMTGGDLQDQIPWTEVKITRIYDKAVWKVAEKIRRKERLK